LIQFAIGLEEATPEDNSRRADEGAEKDHVHDIGSKTGKSENAGGKPDGGPCKGSAIFLVSRPIRGFSQSSPLKCAFVTAYFNGLLMFFAKKVRVRRSLTLPKRRLLFWNSRHIPQFLSAAMKSGTVMFTVPQAI